MLLRHLAVVVLGAAGVAAAVWGHGSDGVRGGIGILVFASCWSALLTLAWPVRWWSLPAAASVTVIGLGTVAFIGRAPLIIAMAATAVARGAVLGSVLGRAPRSGARPRGPSAAALVIPPLALGQVLSYRMAPTALVLALVGLAAVVLAVQERSPGRLAPMASSIDRLARAGGSAAMHLVMLAVALPMIYLPGAIAGLFRRLVRRRSDGGWVEPSAMATQGRDARHPFSSPPPRVAVMRHVGAGLVVLVVVALVVVPRDGPVAVPGRSSPGASRSPSGPDREVVSDPDGSIADRLDQVPFSQRPALSGVPFADALQEETYEVQLVPDPDTGFGLADRSGELVNVVDGVRVTSSPSCDGCPTARIFLVGGSLVFGIGQRDAHTIASAMVSVAAADDVNLEVVNLAVPGWTLTQEQAAVERQIVAGEDGPPDLVVFLDGYNDSLATLMDLLLDGAIPPGPAELDSVKAEALLDREGGFGAFPGDAYGVLAAKRYQATSRPFDESLRTRGIRVARFFQPDASSSAVQRAGVDALGVLPPDFYDSIQMDRVLSASAAQLARDGDGVDLRSAFRDLEDPVYIDTAHVNEAGAALLAQDLYDELRAAIRSAAR